MPVALSAQRLIDRETGKVTWQTTGSRTEDRQRLAEGVHCPTVRNDATPSLPLFCSLLSLPG